MVGKWITWPHELVYMVDGKPAIYAELTFSLFINGYLSVLDTVKKMAKRLMLKQKNSWSILSSMAWNPSDHTMPCDYNRSSMTVLHGQTMR